jgi:MraZ protein
MDKFSGNYDYKVDEKGRIPIPPSFRGDLKGSAVLAKVAEKCITGYSKAGWERVLADLGSESLADAEMRKLKRAIVSGAYEVEIDGQGRVVLPFKLRSHASIGDAVVVAGTGSEFEIWQPELWAAELGTVEEEAWQLIEKLHKRKLEKSAQ